MKEEEGLLVNPNPRNGVSSVRFCASAFVLFTLKSSFAQRTNTKPTFTWSIYDVK